MSERLPENHEFSHYRIVSKIGAGGMGEVYRAHDTRLDREVAIKMLPTDFASDEDRLKRFEQEAKATSALNHPNILTVYDIGEHDGSPFIVAELLDGEELRDRLDDGPIPLRKAVEYAQQIVSGLSAAHEKGIVHRDLKPENLFITKDDRVKILDFGLAKLRAANADPTSSEDATRKALTNPGVVMGTAGYMSPEQVRGHAIDQRSDIFSFGVILYEMLTGRRAFAGDSIVELMHSILKEDVPELADSEARIPPALDKLMRRCIEKKPDHRFHSAHDLGFALEAMSTPTSSSGATLAMAALTLPSGRSRNGERLAWIAAVSLLALAFSALAFIYLRRPPVETTAIRFSVPLPGKATRATSPALSPDGRRVAFVASSEGKTQVWIRAIDSLAAQPLAGTEDAVNLFWSPDSRSVGFFAAGKLKKVDALGGPPQTLCDAARGRGGTWNADGVIVFTPDTQAGLYRVPASGGLAVQITTPDASLKENSHRWPVFLPDGRHFLFFGRSTQPENRGIYVGSLDSNERKLLFASESGAQYAATGQLLFLHEKTLMVQRFDTGKLQLGGEPVPIAEMVGEEGPNGTNSHLGYFSVSANGALVYMTGTSDDRHYVWFDRSGKEVGSVNPSGDLNDLRLSPDGKRAALQFSDTRGGTVNDDIWLVDLERNIPTRFTFNAGVDDDPVWSPDGTRLLFTSERDGKRDIYQKPSNGAGTEELVFTTGHSKESSDWSSDGRYILFETYDENDPQNRADLWVLPLFGDKQPFPFLATEFNEVQGHFSTDGRWVAYTSDESGKAEVYVQSFPASGGKWQISTGGGGQPVWARDGRELFYIDPDRKLMSVEVKTGVNFGVGVPRPLFDTGVQSYTANNRYAVSPDGQRFLVNVPVETQTSAPITVVMNWPADLK